VFTAFFGKTESRAYWRAYAGFAAFTIMLCVAAGFAARAVPLGGIPGLFAKAAAATAVTSLCMALAFRNDVRDILAKFRRRN